MARRWLHWMWCGLVASHVAIAVLVFAACTPDQRRVAIPAGERIVCIVIRAVDPKLDPICATADELAPFVPALLEARRESPPVGSAAAPLVAFEMPPPHRSAPRRHCAQWVSTSDAGAEAAAP